MVHLSDLEAALGERKVDLVAEGSGCSIRRPPSSRIGHTAVLRDRIEGSIKRLKAETSEQHFNRLLALVEGKFGRGVMAGDAIGYLKCAISLRGKSAHGHFNPENDAAFRAFVKSTRAMEALCYLLTALDLPIDGTGMNRVRDNPLIRDHRASYDCSRAVSGNNRSIKSDFSHAQ